MKLVADKDFGELVFRLHRVAGGVVLIRLEGVTPTTKATIVSAAFHRYGRQMLKAFSVITPGAVRIRPRA